MAISNFEDNKCGNYWFWSSPVRFYGREIYLWEESDTKWHFNSATCNKSSLPKSCYSWVLLKSYITNCKDTIQMIEFCLLALFPNSFHIFCYSSVYLNIFATLISFICLTIWILFSAWKMNWQITIAIETALVPLSGHLSVWVNCLPTCAAEH